MVERVYDSFFQCLDWIVEETNTFCNMLLLNDIFSDNRILKISKCAIYQLRDTTIDCCLTKVVRPFYTSFWENYNIDLSIFEELFRMLAEHHSCNVLNHTILRWAIHQLHLFQERV